MSAEHSIHTEECSSMRLMLVAQGNFSRGNGADRQSGGVAIHQNCDLTTASAYPPPQSSPLLSLPLLVLPGGGGGHTRSPFRGDGI